MKELFRERDYTRVGYYQSILEAVGIPTHVRNRDLVTMTTEVPIPEFFPALCVVNDEDYARALEVLRAQVATENKEGEKPQTQDMPFEMRGIVLAGLVVIFGSILLFGVMSLLIYLPHLDAAVRVVKLPEWAVGLDRKGLGLGRDPGPPIIHLLVSGGMIVVGVFAIALATRCYFAARRRRTSGKE